MKYKKYLVFVILFTCGFIFLNIFEDKNDVAANEPENTPNQMIDNNSYSNVLSEWLENGYKDDVQLNKKITPLEFKNNQDYLIPKVDSYGYHHAVFYLRENHSLEFDVYVEKSGLYQINLDYLHYSKSVLPVEISVLVNDEILYNEATQMTLDSLWHNMEIEEDRYGNEVLPRQEQSQQWLNSTLRDTPRVHDRLKFLLEQGMNTITVSLKRGELFVGDISVYNEKEILSYDDYFNHDTANIIHLDDYDKYQAEQIYSTNQPSIRPGVSKEAGVTPFDITHLKINILDGNTYKKPGQKVNWVVNAPESGYYQLTFKVKQDFDVNNASYRNLYINGEIPFKEAKYIPFIHSNKWKNITLSNHDNQPYYFYLEEGENILSLEVDSTLYQEIYEGIQRIMVEVNDLTLDIKQLTGNNSDKNRDWDMLEYIPDLKDKLYSWRNTIDTYYHILDEMNYSKKESREMVLFKMAIKNLDRLIEDYNELPYKLNVLSEGSGSVSQLLGDSLTHLIEQPLSIDAFYLHDNDVDLPNSEPNFFIKLWVGIKRFFLSFFITPYDEGIQEDEVNIWINRPRPYVDLMQRMADKGFTKESNIKVKFSIMPDEGKLVLSNAADTPPDLAMGIHTNLSYQLALRDAVYDLRNFEDFEDSIGMYKEGALIPFVHDGGVYGLPDTQNFNVLFYRKDIMEKLDIPIPETWDDVISILPELQRYGMNFFVPLAYANSYKTFDTTSPFIYQFGGALYDENGMKTSLDNDRSVEAINFMTDLFSIYSLPMQVPNFYNHFRYGMLPIGIGDFGVYVQLMYAAPELKGLWEIKVIPGIENEDGEIVRYATGPGQGMTIFDDSDKKKEAWEFMKWWMKTETQVEFDQLLTTTLGPEFMWNSANIEAFELSTWPSKDKEVILEQWEWLRNVPNTPASYMVERELSNIWNKVVMSGESVRDAVDDSVMKINREITRKFIEFGYVDKYGVEIKPYPIATLDMIRSWVKDNDE